MMVSVLTYTLPNLSCRPVQVEHSVPNLSLGHSAGLNSMGDDQRYVTSTLTGCTVRQARVMVFSVRLTSLRSIKKCVLIL